MLNFFLILFGSFILFDRLTQGYLNPYKLIMVFGKKGSGKTTYLTKMALQHIKKGWNVYSTVEIPGTRLFNVDDIGPTTFPQRSCVLIDEVGMIWDSRDFKNFKPNVRNFFKYQRQYKVKVFLFSQTFDVDKKLRDLTDQMFLLKNVARVFSIARRINKTITITNPEGDKPSSLADQYEFAPLFTADAVQITFIPRYVEYFTSYNPTKLPMISYEDLEMNDLQRKNLSTFKWILNKIKYAGRVAYHTVIRVITKDIVYKLIRK